MFGEVAELYDASRPGYPDAVVDDLLELGQVREHERVLEVGAGTGKATVLFAARGVGVLAIEPSAAMAAVARRNCASYAEVEIVGSDFEHWDPAGREFPLLYCAQAWHWIDPQVRFARARAALSPGGVLAAFWNRPAWGSSPLRDALREVYRTAVPDMIPDGPMHPSHQSPSEGEDWERQIADLDQFDHAELRRYDWSQDYSAPEFTRLLATLSEIAILDEERREALLTGVRAAIEEHGGTLLMPMRTQLCIARAI